MKQPSINLVFGTDYFTNYTHHLLQSIPILPELPENIMNKGGLVSFLIGCLLIIPNVYWIVLAESMDFSIHITMQSFFFNSLLSILLLILINIVLKRFSVNLQLSSQQLIVIYIMINIGSAVAGHGTLQVLIPLLTHAFWYSTPENDWANLFHSFIPSFLHG